MSVFQTGERIIVTSGQFMGRHGEIAGTVEEDGVVLVKVQLDNREGTDLFRASLLIKERMPRNR